MPHCSKKTSAKWSASIAVRTYADGLHIEVVGGESPVFADVETDGECSFDVLNEHMRQLPSEIDLRDTLSDLKALLVGTWDYSYPGMEAYALSSPVFTRNGDLIVELSAYSSTSSFNGGGVFKVVKNAISKYLHVVVLLQGSLTNYASLTGNLVTDNLLSPGGQLTSTSSIDTPLNTPPLGTTVSGLPVNTKAPLQPTPPMMVKPTVALEKDAIPSGQKGANGNAQPTPPMIVKPNEVALEKNAIPNGQKGANGNGFHAAVA